MITQTATIAKNTFIEGIRQPIFFVVVMVSGLLQLLITWSTGFAMGWTTSGEVSSDNKLMLDVGLATIFVCGMLLAAFVATAVVSREIENKTVLTVVSKPIPRPAVILGKYLGIAGAITVAVVIMICFLQLGLRHGVMSTASDQVDQPVVAFGLAAVLGAILIAAACNFLYGWYFSQTAMLVMAPAMLAAFFLVLLISKKWEWQPIATDFKPQVMIACAALVMAILVLCAIATAASTRLGQVMTIVTCAGVFLFGLLSNSFLGRHVFLNAPVGIIAKATPANAVKPGWDALGSTYTIAFESPPNPAPKPGDSFYYSPSPTGYPMIVPRYVPYSGDPTNTTQLSDRTTPPALVITEVNRSTITVRRAGDAPFPTERSPEPGDYVFTAPTALNPVAAGAWSIIPNMHYFWLLDAVSQNQPVPLTHLLKVVLYGVLQIAAFLAIGIVLFQRRDVG